MIVDNSSKKWKIVFTARKKIIAFEKFDRHVSSRNKLDLDAIIFNLTNIEIDICLAERDSWTISGRNAETERKACYLGKNSQGRSTAEGKHFHYGFSDHTRLLAKSKRKIEMMVFCVIMQDKLKLRLKTLEDGLRHFSSLPASPNTVTGSPKTEKSNHIFGFLTSNAGLKKRSSSQPRGSTIKSTPLLQPNSMDEQNSHSTKKLNPNEHIVRRSLWASRSKVADSSGNENVEKRVNLDENIHKYGTEGKVESNVTVLSERKDGNQDTVSGFLYDRLQKEVISLRKCCEGKDDLLNAKDQQIMVHGIIKNLLFAENYCFRKTSLYWQN